MAERVRAHRDGRVRAAVHDSRFTEAVAEHARDLQRGSAHEDNHAVEEHEEVVHCRDDRVRALVVRLLQAIFEHAENSVEESDGRVDDVVHRTAAETDLGSCIRYYTENCKRTSHGYRRQARALRVAAQAQEYRTKSHEKS